MDLVNLMNCRDLLHDLQWEREGLIKSIRDANENSLSPAIVSVLSGAAERTAAMLAAIDNAIREITETAANDTLTRAAAGRKGNRKIED